MEKEEGGKVGGGTRCHGGMRAGQSASGVRVLVRCGGDGGGVGACAVVGHRATKDQVIKTVLFLAHVYVIRPS